jgi:hypothetical protein
MVPDEDVHRDGFYERPLRPCVSVKGRSGPAYRAFTLNAMDGLFPLDP